MEMVKRDSIPPVPALSDEKRELTGINAHLSDLALNGLERRARKEKRKIFVETEIQLLRDRCSEVIQAYRTHVAAAQEVIKKLAEEYAQGAMEMSDARISDNKLRAMEKAADDFTAFILNVRADMPDKVKDALMNNATTVFNQTLEKIGALQFSIDEAIGKNYPNKKSSSFMDRFKR
jgi:uncharacterized membrane-anchored protein YhcB (DUF1043 family)